MNVVYCTGDIGVANTYSIDFDFTFYASYDHVILLPGHVTAAADIALHHHAAPVAAPELPVLHVVRTRVPARALTLTPGWTRVKEVEVGAEAGDVPRAVQEVHGVVSIVIIGH